MASATNRNLGIPHGRSQNGLACLQGNADPDRHNGSVPQYQPTPCIQGSLSYTLYLHEAMQQPDKHKFLEAMVKEVEDQSDNGNWKIILRNKVPQGVPILHAVWSMKHKCKIVTHEVYKWKARLTLGGSRQKHGVNDWEMYAPVASWPMI
jgi:hypothetical protein